LRSFGLQVLSCHLHSLELKPDSAGERVNLLLIEQVDIQFFETVHFIKHLRHHDSLVCPVLQLESVHAVVDQGQKVNVVERLEEQRCEFG